MLYRSFFVLIFSLLFISAGWAEPVTGLYESEVPVEDQSQEQRQQAIRKALEEVLDKVATARESTIARDLLNSALERAEHYIQQYRYTEQGLWVHFDNRAVDELLQQDLPSSTTPDEGILLKVTGIRSLSDYVRVTNYLASLKLLSAAWPRIVAPDSTLFQIRARNGRGAVAQAIVRDGFLQRIDGDAPVLSFLYSP